MSSDSTYPQVVPIHPDGKLEFPQADERGWGTRKVPEAANDSGKLATEQLLLVQQGLWEKQTFYLTALCRPTSTPIFPGGE